MGLELFVTADLSGLAPLLVPETNEAPASRDSVATYKGRNYRLLAVVRTKLGDRAHLQFFDDSKDFWVNARSVEIRGPYEASTSPSKLGQFFTAVRNKFGGKRQQYINRVRPRKLRQHAIYPHRLA